MHRILTLLLVAFITQPIYPQSPERVDLSKVLKDPTTFPLEISTRPVTYLSAKSATIVEEEDGVLILAEALSSQKKYGAILEIIDQPNKFIEVFDLITIDGRTFASYPPRVQTPLPDPEAPGVTTYLITGDPCTKVGVAIRSDSLPVWLEIQLEGCNGEPDPTPDPDPDPTPDPELIAELKKVTESAVKELQDPITQKSISDNLAKVLVEASGTPSEYYTKIQNSISNGLLEAEVRPPYKDWFRIFRKPIHDLVSKEALTTPQLQEAFRAIQQVLNSTKSEPLTTTREPLPLGRPPSNIVTVFTSEGCAPCKQWIRDMKPLLESKGWAVLESPTTTGFTPRYIIECNGRTTEYTGYLNASTFNLIASSLLNN